MSEIMLIGRKTKLSTSLVRGCNDAEEEEEEVY